jgi:hypothetical protein
MKTLFVVLIGIACLCFLGNIQPIRVVGRSADQNQRIKCKQCGGAGSIPSSENCPRCGGTGKGEWHFKSHADKRLGSQQPICQVCRGTGKRQSATRCAQCNGAGYKNSPEAFRIKTVRADLSLWEKTLASCGVKPDDNARPQRRFGGYPLISKFIQTMGNPEREVRVLKWDSIRQEENAWIVKTMLEFKDKDGQPKEQGMEFIVENREVKGARKVEP